MLYLDKTKQDPQKVQLVNLLTQGKNQPVYILGRNENAYNLSKIIHFDGFIDDFTNESEWYGKPVYKSENIVNKKEAIVVSCSLAIYPVKALQTLKQNGFNNVITYLDFVKYSKSNIEVKFLKSAKEDLKKIFNKYQWLYDLVEDQISKDTLRDILNFRKNFDICYMKKYKVDFIGQYFESFLNLQEGEVFIDAGGFDGQTTKEFIKHCPRYKAIDFFEPSQKNLKSAKINLKNFSNITYFLKGLSNKNDKLQFATEVGSASSISQNGTVTIEVDTLDKFVHEKVTFIKNGYRRF